MGNSKKKGNRGELKICKILTERFGVKFNRVPSSGAFGTTHILQKDAQKVLSGDLIVPTLFQFSSEIKTGYNLDFIYFLTEKSSNDRKTFQEFCEQSCEDASRIEGRIPMIIYTKDRREPIVAIPVKGHSREKQVKNIINKGNKKFLVSCFDLSKKFKKWEKWILMSLSDLLLEEDDFFFDKEE